MNKSLGAVILVVVAILIAGLAYFIFQNQKLTKQLVPSPQITPYTQSASPQVQNPSPEVTRKLTLKDIEVQIEASINSKNYQALAGYMIKPKINFSLMSSECCEPMSPDEATNQMDYIKDGAPFTFNQQNTTILNLKAKNPQLTPTFIGLSQNSEQLAAFTLDANNKISAIQLSVSYKLYTQ